MYVVLKARGDRKREREREREREENKNTEGTAVGRA